MAYAVKEIFLTLQGEGMQAGRAAVFCRFSGCNVGCSWCDTDWVGTDGPNGGEYPDADALVERIADLWIGVGGTPYVILTGGEPSLQADAPLIEALHAAGFEVGMESNGTHLAPPGLDWLCISPKAGHPLVQRTGSELKVVVPQEGQSPLEFEDLEFSWFLVQPLDGPDLAASTAHAVKHCLQHPRWRLSVQTHKTLGIP